MGGAALRELHNGTSEKMTETKSCVIRRAAGPVRLSCADPAWEAAERLAIDQFPWYESGQKQGTDVAMLYDDDGVYLLFVCEDKHIFSRETRPNGDVYLDSCVEFFAMVDPPRRGGYFNFEANCCGTVHLGFGEGREGRRLAPPEVHNEICAITSIPTPTREESSAADGWWLAAMLPFATISQFAGFEVAPKSGTLWRANFYRCGGKTDTQYACWNPIGCEKPDFHRPEFFGDLTFE